MDAIHSALTGATNAGRAVFGSLSKAAIASFEFISQAASSALKKLPGVHSSPSAATDVKDTVYSGATTAKQFAIQVPSVLGLLDGFSSPKFWFGWSVSITAFVLFIAFCVVRLKKLSKRVQENVREQGS
jgi:hypothetical protein